MKEQNIFLINEDGLISEIDLMAHYRGRALDDGEEVLGFLSYYVDENKKYVWCIRSIKTNAVFVVNPNTVQRDFTRENIQRLNRYFRDAIHDNDMSVLDGLQSEIDRLENELKSYLK
jgi:hypothetical protein